MTRVARSPARRWCFSLLTRLFSAGQNRRRWQRLTRWLRFFTESRRVSYFLEERILLLRVLQEYAQNLFWSWIEIAAISSVHKIIMSHGRSQGRRATERLLGVATRPRLIVVKVGEVDSGGDVISRDEWGRHLGNIQRTKEGRK